MTHSVLIDTDPGNDDAVLLALALATDDVDVDAVTTVAGNVGLEDTTRNARAILDWFGASDTPVAPGAAAPLVREPDDASHVHGGGGLHGHPPEPATETVSTAAATTIVERARARPGELTLLAVGPLTNVALALALEPELPELLDDLYVMGGAAFVSGNATPSAEYNFYADPEAAHRVVRDAAPKIVGLDVTNHATVPPETIREWADGEEPFRTMASWLAYAAPEDVEDALAEEGQMRSHDAVVGVDLLSDVLTFESYPASVETCGSCRGALVADDRDRSEASSNAEVAVAIDADRFRETLLGTLEAAEIEP
jgi:purine nucleosidase